MLNQIDAQSAEYKSRKKNRSEKTRKAIEKTCQLKGTYKDGIKHLLLLRIVAP